MKQRIADRARTKADITKKSSKSQTKKKSIFFFSRNQEMITKSS